MKTGKSMDWWLVGIIIAAFFLRVFRIESLTEFLGDQGRTMLVMRDFLVDGIIPLAGPSTLSGHNLGPLFYYLLIPGYIGGPVGMSVWMAILGVAAVLLLYETSRLMFGLWPARLSSLLWATSPLIVTSDRVIWEPNLVPLFAVLFIYLLYRAHVSSSRRIWAAIGAVVSILVQLHYPNILFAGLTGVYLLGSVGIRRRSFSDAVQAGIWWIAGCLVFSLPFIVYEYTTGFADITGIGSIMLGGGSEIPGKRVMLGHVVDYAFRVFGKSLPFMKLTFAPWLISAWIIFVLLYPSKKNIFFSLWFFGGLVAMAGYTGVVYDHYLYFLTPVPFFIIGSVLGSVKKLPWSAIISVVVVLLSVIQLMKSDVLSFGSNDISRTRAAVIEMKAIAGGRPFSFTLTSSRSYSDLHYRYFMKVMGLNTVPVTDTGYPVFMLVCDTNDCPDVSDITAMTELPVLCFEGHCSGFYPGLPLRKEWAYQRDVWVSVNGNMLGRIYVFERR